MPSFFDIQNLENYNVCIIGSGPAATSAAITLAQNNIKTVLLTQTKISLEKQHFGETLSHSLISQLSDFGIQEAFQKIAMPVINGSISSWGSKHIEAKSTFLYPFGSGLIFKRNDFESVLKNKALELGVKVYSYNIINSKKASSKKWVTIMNLGSKNLTINSDFVIVATGRDNPNLFNLSNKISADKLIGCLVTLSENKYPADKSIYVDSSENGWFYSTINSESKRIICYFTDGDLIKNKTETFHLNFLRNTLENLPSVSRVIQSSDLNMPSFFKIVSANTTFRKYFYQDGIIVCGDTAQTYDPLSSQGICNAIRDGQSIGKVLTEFYDGNDNALKKHETARRQDFVKYLQYRHNIYSQEGRWRENLFWERRHCRENIKLFLNKFQK